MNNLKRVAVFLGIFAVLVIVAVSYKGNDILNRSIVLGLGVDSDGDGVKVTAEIVSPDGGEKAGAFSKVVSGSGKTVAQALQKISEKSGKETSLGQCVLLVYGEDFFQTDFSSAAEFFIKSDSFRESAAVCCCSGSAEQLFFNGDAIAKSVSIALADKLNGLAKDVALPSCDLLTFARSQTELYQTGFLNFVHFEPSPSADSQNPDQTQGSFDCSRVAVFRNHRFVGLLTPEETAGFALLADVEGNTFAVQNEGKLLALRANSKKVDLSQNGQTVSVSVTMQVKLARTDSFGAGGRFAAKTDSEIPASLLLQAKEQATRLALLFLQKQVEWDFDLVNFHEIFRRKAGTTDQLLSMKMSDISVDLNVYVVEK